MEAADLWRLTTDELAQQLAAGHPIDPSALDDTEYRGVSLGVSELVKKLSWVKFRKCFHRDPATGELRGWNVRLQQNGVEAPDLPMMRRGRPRAFGHYAVVPPRGYPMPKWKGKPLYCHQGLMLDYAKGRSNPPHLRLLRDPIVAVRPGDASLLLGWSYLDLGLLRLPTPSFFTLERSGPLQGPPVG